MIYVSLTVHENLPIILNQLINFKRFLDSKVVVHLSEGSSISPQALKEAIQNNLLTDQVIVNPDRVETSWGNIFSAHISNVRFIESISKNPDIDIVAFHSSNDMLCREGLRNHLERSPLNFHTRSFDDRFGSYWWPLSHAQKDKNLRECLLSEFGRKNGGIVGGQIEGSTYTVGILKKILKLVMKYNLTDVSRWQYPREEILFPTLAVSIGVKPQSSPYIYSEIQRIDAYYYNLRALFEKFMPPNMSEFVAKSIRYPLKSCGCFSIRKKDVDLIRQENIKPLVLKDYHPWHPYNSASCLYGVKRVPRINCALRDYISRL